MTPELWLYDFRYQMSSMTVKEKTGYPDICYIAIDKPSRDYFEKNYGVKWPWPRSYYTELLKKLKKIKPSVVAFDIMFFKDKPEEDGEFSAAIKEAKNVITGSSYTYSHDKEIKELKLPNETIRNSVYGVGFLNIVSEPDSIREKNVATREFARRISLIEKDSANNKLYYHFER
jgi:CHASE2 domain-containing sensor protein